MNSNEIFGKMNKNIINILNNFKRGDIDSNYMNERIIFNLSSVCKFIKDKNLLNNKNSEMVIPSTRFHQNLNETITAESQNQYLESTPKTINNNRNIISFEPSDKDNKEDNNNKINKEDNSFLRDINKNDNFNNSIVEGSLFSQSIAYDNKSEFRASIISENISKADVSTIYGRNINYGNEDTMSVISNSSFAKFLNQRINYKANRFNNFSYT